jgi:prolyl-tRNA editing enzyme YbaK/EbsC (Cys-tRNA(Pro) deacylase)
MDGILEKAAVRRFKEAADSLGVKGEINILAETARTAIDAANGLGIEVGQIASSLIFKLPSGNPLLIITSGRHRVDTELVAKNLGLPELGRADANYVKEVSGYSVGGVPPMGFVSKRLPAYPAPLPLGKLLLGIRHFVTLLPRVALPELTPLSVAGFRVRL